jgi:uncharacterized protein
MSELIDNSRQRKDLLKNLILELHEGASPDDVRGKLTRMIGQVPYGDVVQIEQELINEGLPQERVLDLCDVHAAALRGQIDLTGMKEAPAGHPVHTFYRENIALEQLTADCLTRCDALLTNPSAEELQTILSDLTRLYSLLWEVDKHYRRKENLLFPFLEKKGISGPPKVMWGKHDQARALLKGALDGLQHAKSLSIDEAVTLANFVLRPAATAVSDMILKETQILLPMCMDLLTDIEWYEISEQSPDIGFCLFDPAVRWVPADLDPASVVASNSGRVVLPTGSFNLSELAAMFSTLPVDLTFVDQDDKVRFFSLGPHRIFDRNRTILGRQVQLCHPPSSVHIVQKILDDFRAGKQDKAEFWITLQGKFIHISYYALRGEDKQYLGTIEVTTDLTHLRSLEGERRLLQYESDGENSHV